MAANPGILTPETFDFFRELERNNNKPWMDANRERYRESVVEPFRQLLERLSPHALKLDSDILITGRTTRISRASIATSDSRGTKPLIAPTTIFFSARTTRLNTAAHSFISA